MIKSIGYTQDGGAWFSLSLDVDRDEVAKNENKTVQLTAIIPMSEEKAKEVRDALTVAIDSGKKWLETGVDPNAKG